MSADKDRAERLLVHYFRTVFKAAGRNWDEDHDAEIGIIVDSLHNMVLHEIQKHAEGAPHIYADGSTA